MLQREKLTSELQLYQHLQPQQRPSKPPLQQIKHPPHESNQHPQKKSHHSSSQVQNKGHHASANSKLEPAIPNGEQVLSDLRNEQEEPINLRNKLGHIGSLANPIHNKCPERADLANSRRYKGSEQEEEASPFSARWPELSSRLDSAYVNEKHPDSSRIKRAEHARQIDLVNPNGASEIEQADNAKSSLRRTEQGKEPNHSRYRRGELTDQALAERTQHTGELDFSQSRNQPGKEVDLHRSRSRRLEGQQLDDGAILKRPQRHQQPQEENHITPYPKRLRSGHQGHQEQGRSELGTPKGQPHIKLPQISQQHPLKKLTQGSVQGPHGLHQSSKISTLTSSPHPVPPSTPASMQSSAPSLSTSAVSDEAQKPSKKRKLRSLLEPESTDGQSVAADDAGGHEVIPAASPTADLPGVPSSVEVLDSKDCATANSSPKLMHQGPQLVPARRLLNSILDRLQKKDKFGVFAEPVDPKEVPNYYDIIKDPMDFGTMRNRISSGHYTSIELFQKDIFLICDNAMQYNGKGTVYFRHARAIKDVAERILEDLKLSGVSVEMDEPTSKFRNGGTNRSTEKHDSCMNTGSPSEARIDNLDEVSGYFFRTNGLIDGRRSQAIDEFRRSSYSPMTTPFQGNDLLLTTISGESSYLVPTGYQMDFPYSRSLARFAADLGPIVWKIAAEKIKRALPPGCPFGPGWVGEKETGGVMLASSSKQPLLGQSTKPHAAKLPTENGAVATSEKGILPEIQSKTDTQSNSQEGYAQQQHEIATKAEYHQPPTKLLNEIRSPMVFGNSLLQSERPERLDQGILGQSTAQPPMGSFRCSDNGKPLGQAHAQVDEEASRKIDQASPTAGNNIKFAGQVNLNHPLSLQPDEGGSVDDCVSNRNGVANGRDAQENNTSASSNAATSVGNVGAFPFDKGFNLGGAFNFRPPQADRVNPGKVIMGDMGMNTAPRNQHDGRGATEINRFNSSNESPSTKAGLMATSAGKNDVVYQPDNFQMSRGSFLPHNLHMSLQQPSGISGAGGNSFDLTRPTSTLSQSGQGFTFQSNLNTGFKQTAGSSQHSNSSNPAGSRDVSPPEAGLSTLPASAYPERAVGEKFKEAGDLREKEMLSLTGRMTSGAASGMPRKGFIPERGFAMQQPEPRNGQASGSDLAINAHNLDQINRKQNASGGLSVVGFTPGLPTSNGVSMVRDVPVWVPAQQRDLAVTGKGGSKVHNQVSKGPLEQSEGSSGGTSLMRLQTTGVQDPQVFSFGNKKHISSMPHFLQQQLGSDTTHSLPNHHHQVQPPPHTHLHVQSNSLLPNAQNPSASESRESNFVRQFQLPPSHRGFAPTGNPPWQYMPPQMVAQGSHQPFAAAPDLNVSLPLTKSSFDQSSGSDIQQPDLALQL